MPSKKRENAIKFGMELHRKSIYGETEGSAPSELYGNKWINNERHNASDRELLEAIGVALIEIRKDISSIYLALDIYGILKEGSIYTKAFNELKMLAEQYANEEQEERQERARVREEKRLAKEKIIRKGVAGNEIMLDVRMDEQNNNGIS